MFSGESFANAVDTEVIGWGSRLAVGIGLVPVLRKTNVVPVSTEVCSTVAGPREGAVIR